MSDLNIHVRLSRRTCLGVLTLGLLAWAAAELGSENVTLTTQYPAPSGVYTQMITTGKTLLSRDGSYVSVGTPNAPGNGAKMEVNGNINLGGPSPTYRVTNVADPIANSDVATKAYVLAAGGGGKSYITTLTATRWSSSAPFCPPGWTKETSWQFQTTGGWDGGSYSYYNGWTQTLCSK